jgi:hypothetical protein
MLIKVSFKGTIALFSVENVGIKLQKAKGVAKKFAIG